VIAKLAIGFVYVILGTEDKDLNVRGEKAKNIKRVSIKWLGDCLVNYEVIRI